MILHPRLVKKYFEIEIGTGQFFDYDSFIEYSNRFMCTPLKGTSLRQDEQGPLIESLKGDNVPIVSGVPGVGKTKFALESCKSFAQANDYELLVLKNNDHTISDELKGLADSGNSYILLVDDAYQFGECKIEELLKSKIDSNGRIKLCLTVRDYMSDNVFKWFKSPYEPFKLEKFADSAIESLVKAEGITNYDGIQIIIDVSKGNARIAEMCSRLMVENKSICGLKIDKIYEKYYADGPYFSEVKTPDCSFTVAVVSFFNTIDTGDIAWLSGLFSEYGISESEFKKCCRHLADLEIFDSRSERIYKISEETLGNLILKQELIDKKTISLKQLTRCGFSRKEKDVTCSVRTLYYQFYDESAEYISDQIAEVWDDFESHPLTFKGFITDIGFLQSSRALVYLKSEIEKIDADGHDLTSAEINEKSITSDFYLNTLYQVSNLGMEECRSSFELMLKYYSKKPSVFPQLLDVLKRMFGIDRHASTDCYALQEKFTEKLKNESDNWANFNLTVLYLKMCQGYLSVTVSREEEMHISIIPFSLQQGQQFRAETWGNVIEISKDRCHYTLILELLNSYCIDTYRISDQNKDLIIFDFQCIDQLVSLFDCTGPEEYEILDRLCDTADKYSIKTEACHKHLADEKYRNYRLMMASICDESDPAKIKDFIKTVSQQSVNLLIDFLKIKQNQETTNCLSSIA